MTIEPQTPTLRQSVRWGEHYVSSALNKKHAGIIPTGVFHGFRLRPGGPMRVFVDHDPDYPRSVAVVERNGFSITVIMEDSGYVSIPASGVWFIVIEAFYIESATGYQRIVARERVEEHHVILGKVTVPPGSTTATVITAPMIDDGQRQTGADITNAALDNIAAVVEDMRLPREAVWTISAEIKSGAILHLPDAARYAPGLSTLDLDWDGLRCFRGRQFEEIVETGKEDSGQIRLLFTAPAGSEFRALARPFSLKPELVDSNAFLNLKARIDNLEDKYGLISGNVPFYEAK